MSDETSALKIGIDFDDVIVETMVQFEIDWNRAHPDNKIAHRDVTTWRLSDLLGVDEGEVGLVFHDMSIHLIPHVPDAIPGIKDLIDDGHEVVILSANPDFEGLRRFLDGHALWNIPVVTDIADKAIYARRNEFDVIVDDNPHTLTEAIKYDIHAIRYWRPWNAEMGAALIGDMSTSESVYFHTARTWGDVLSKVRFVERFYGKQVNTFLGIDPTGMVGSPDYDFPAYNVVPPPQSAFGILNLGNEELRMTGMYDEKLEPVNEVALNIDTDEIITNAKGAKQANLNARYDLLPGRAIAAVAGVLNRGEQKYGKDNWRGLSVDEVNNHTIGHLIDYLVTGETEDLEHAATRALMALEIVLGGGTE